MKLSVWVLWLLASAGIAGCAGDPEAAGTEGRPSHIVPGETAFYFVIPGEGAKPDGHFKPGEKMRLLEPGETYSLVRSVRGTKGYVANRDLKTKEEADDKEDD